MKLRFVLILIIPFLLILSSCTLRKTCLKSLYISRGENLKNTTIAILPGSDHVNDHYLISQVTKEMDKDKVFKIIKEKDLKADIKNYTYINPMEDIARQQKASKDNPDLSSLIYLNNVKCDYFIILHSVDPMVDEVESGEDTKTFYQVRIHVFIIKKQGLKIVGESNCNYRQKSSIAGFLESDNGQLRLVMQGAAATIMKDIKEY